MEFRESWDLGLVKQLLDVLPAHLHNDRSILNSVLDDGREHRQVTYKPGGGIGATLVEQGFATRSYGKGIQPLSSKCKRFLFAGKLRDIDVKCCHPTLLLQLAETMLRSAPTDLLRNLVENRDALFAKIQEEHPELSYALLKKATSVILFGGNYKKLATHCYVDQLSRLAREIRTIQSGLVKRPEFGPFLRAAKRKHGDENRHTVENSTFSFILQHAEAKVMDSLRRFLQTQKSIEIAANMFDGFLVHHDDVKCDNLEQILVEAAAFVRHETELEVVFVEKPIEPISIEELSEAKSPAAHIDTAIQKVFVFDVEDVLGFVDFGYQEDRIVGIKIRNFVCEHLQRVRDSGFAVGLFTDLPNLSILRDLEQGLADQGFKFDFVLHKDHCFKAQTKEQQEIAGTWRSLAPHFANLKNVRYITARPESVLEQDCIFNVAPWDPDLDQDFAKLVQDALQSSFVEKLAGIRAEDLPLATRPDDPTKKCIHPIQFGPGQKLLIIKAPVGSGKSHAMKQFIKDQCQGKSIIIVTSRIQLAHTFKGLLADPELQGANAFHAYFDQTNRQFTANRAIVQWESLTRVRANNYDVVIVDEVRMMIGQMTSVETNRAYLMANAALFERQCNRASNVLFLDADIEANGAVETLVQMMFKPQESRFLRYHEAVLRRSFHELKSKVEMVHKMEETLRRAPNGLIVACFRSKAELDDVCRVLEERKAATREEILRVTRDSDEVTMAGLQNMAATLHDKRVLAYTSKLVAGCDIQVPVEAVFVFAQNAIGGANAREINQMLFRARNVTGAGDVFLILPPAPKETTRAPATHAKVLATLRQRSVNTKDYIRRMADDPSVKLDAERINVVPEHLLPLLAWTELESRQHFRTGFERSIARHGHTAQLPSVDLDLSADETKELKDDIADAEDANGDDDERRVAAAKAAILEHRTHESPDKRYCDSVFTVLKKFKKEQWPNLTPNEILAFMPRRSIAGRFHYRLLAACDLTLHYDAAEFNNTAVADVAASPARGLTQLNKVLAEIGVENGVRNENTSISAATCQPSAAKWVKELRNVCTDLKIKNPPDVKLSGTGVITLLKAVLYGCFYKLEPSRKRGHNGKRTKSYKIAKMTEVPFRNRVIDITRVIDMLDIEQSTNPAYPRAAEKVQEPPPPPPPVKKPKKKKQKTDKKPDPKQNALDPFLQRSN